MNDGGEEHWAAGPRPGGQPHRAAASRAPRPESPPTPPRPAEGRRQPLPVVQVALQGSWEASFHRYMSAGLTPGLRALGLVLKRGPAEKGLRGHSRRVLTVGAAVLWGVAPPP